MFARPRVPFGARSTLVIVTVAVLAVGAGGFVVSELTGQMRLEAEARLDAHTTSVADDIHALMATASSDIRLARQDVVFEQALEDTPGQLLPADRTAVETAIKYLGERYQVDEICVIRSSGLEAARWVGGKGVASVDSLSPDERTNNPAVIPTLPLANDAFYQTQPYISPDSGRWVVGIATPIVLPSGDHAGILHFEIPIVRFATVLGGSSFGGSSYNLLLDRSGHLLVGPQLAALRAAAGIATDPATAPFPDATATGSDSWRAAIVAAVSGETGATTFTDAGKSYRISYQAVPDSDRIVAVVSPLSELYADVDRAILNLAVTAGPLLLLMLLVTGWFARRMSSANSGLSGLNDRLEATNSALEDASRASSDLARESAVVNQFTELTALTEDEEALAAATLATLDELVTPGDAALHVSNPSQDRAVPEATLGDRKGHILALHELARCPGVRRSNLYVTDDVTARLAYHCPIYPVQSGTLACVPLIALGETVGSIHLHWPEVRELPLPVRLAVSRVSEHAALSIANRRLLSALRGQANTDGRTGLTNSRAFDEAVERRLSLRGDGRAAVLMLDLDHFKEFNDRYGHPAGDEALRAFAHLLTSSTRDEDLAARYGGEEFAIYLPGRGEAEAAEVAERIRERTETTIIPLGPGKTGRITVSVGIAVAPEDGVDRGVLLKAADAALYQAKLAGRNRVVSRSASSAPSASVASDPIASSASSADPDAPRSASRRRRAAAG